MRKIIEYKILWCYSTKELKEKVEEEIKNGWEPLGGPLGGRLDAMFFEFFQSMVKYQNI